jgi:hypothetical protein
MRVESGAVTVQKQRGEYLSLRREFEPTSVRLVIVAESPPISGNYFYNPDGEVSEQLFKALMEQLGIKPKTKLEGLREFQNRGWVLVDATYEPVNAHDNRSRDLVIDGDYPKLCGDLKRLLSDRWSEVPLILIKANVRKLLEPKLNKDGFKVLNKGRSVYFPGSGRQRDFDRQFSEIVQQTLGEPMAIEREKIAREIIDATGYNWHYDDGMFLCPRYGEWFRVSNVKALIVAALSSHGDAAAGRTEAEVLASLAKLSFRLSSEERAQIDLQKARAHFCPLGKGGIDFSLPHDPDISLGDERP